MRFPGARPAFLAFLGLLTFATICLAALPGQDLPVAVPSPDGTLPPGTSGSFDAQAYLPDGGLPPVPAIGADKTVCSDGWDTRFTLRGTDAQVLALATVGNRVYLGGLFSVAGDPHNRLACWDGTDWSDVGTGVNNQVSDLLADGADLYASGSFTTAGGVAATGIARWDGAAWSALGSGITAGAISALAVWNGDLYAAGSFTTAGGVAAARIARWDGAAWSPLGSGLNNSVYALVAGADGLYAAGNFTASGATTLNHIARWDGANWNQLGSGITTTVTALGVQGGNVYASGAFTAAGGVSANRIARWDGTAWFAMGSGLNNAARAFAVMGGQLYVGGSFTTAGGLSAPCLARWDGAAWSAVGDGLTGTGSVSVDALAVQDDGAGGESLLVGGVFRAGGTVTVRNIIRWDGAAWQALGAGMAPDNTVWEIAAGLDAQGGKVIYAGGLFLQAGGAPATYIAAWDVDAGAWKTLGAGVNGEVRTVVANGTDLYVGGIFTTAGGIYNTAYNVARWNGTTWSPLGSGTNGQVEILKLVPNGAGGHDLYAGGAFTTAGGVTVNRIAKWNGTTWSALGTGCNSFVESLAYADNGAGGLDIYAGGQFTTAGGVAAASIAKWDGSTWSAVGGGLTLTGTTAKCEELRVVRSGAGGLLMYVGGSFTAAGGQSIQNLAAWDGTSWAALGSGVDAPVFGLDMKDGVLYVAGAFATAGGVATNGCATWDGANWAAIPGNVTTRANMLLVDGSDLYIAGVNDLTRCHTSLNFARYTLPSTSGVGSPEVPAAAGALAQNAPNPFNPQTEIAFRLDRDAHAVLRVFDARGRAVATLVEGALAAGDHAVRFDGKGLASGLYVYRLEIDGVPQARKMMLVR